jgi:hypothetical protein
MAGKKKEATSEEKGINKVPEQVSAEIVISYKKIPQKTKLKKIHFRQVMPPVKEGNKVPDETPTPPIQIEKP